MAERAHLAGRPGRPAAWIARIARNRAIDELRRRGARPKTQGGSWEAGSGGEAAGEDPADRAELALERRRVRAALGSLPAEQREALSLAFFQGRSHSEIAEALGQPLGTVKTRIRLGMQRLQRLLSAEGEG